MATRNSPIRVFICDDVAELRVLLRIALEEQGGIEVVGEAGDGRTAVEQVARTQPDVVILDLAMPGMNGFEALPQIAEGVPDASVVVLSGLDPDELGDAALDLDAVDFIEKGEGLDAVREVVEEVFVHRDNVDAMRRLYRAYRRGDVEGVLAEIDPNVELIPLPDVGDEAFHGHAGIRRLLDETRENLNIEVRRFRARGDRVVILGRYRMQQEGTLVDSPAAWVTNLRGGKLVRSEAFTSWDGALQRLGAER